MSSVMGVLAARMSDIGRTGGGRVLAQHTGLFVDTGASEPSNPGVVLPAGASALGCMTVVSASLTEPMRPALGLVVAERSKGRSLTKLAWLIWERTSLNVVSTCSAILAPLSSWFLANSGSSWALAWIATCNYLRATLELSIYSVFEPTFLWEWKEVVGTESGTRRDKWWSSPAASPLRNGMTFSLSPSFSHGRMTWVEENRSNLCRHSWLRGNWVVEVPTERVVTSR